MRVLLAMLLSAAVAHAQLPEIRFEAEDFAEVTGGQVRVLNRAEASAGRCVSYWEEPGVAVTCAFEVARAGEYCLTLGYACQWPDTRRQVSVDGRAVPGLEAVLLPGTGTWADFRAITLAGPDGGRARIALEPGPHTLTLTNVDSRGLAWDWALLHGPESLPADAPLSDEELRELADEMPAAAARLLLGEVAQDDLQMGNVTVAMRPSGGMAAFRVGDVFFGMPRPDADVASATIVRPVGLTGLQGRWIAPADRTGAAFVLLTDGASLYCVGALTGSVARTRLVPPPLVQWRQGRPWLLAPEPLRRTAGGARQLTIGGVAVSADRRFRADVASVGFPILALKWTPRVIGNTTVAAWKVGPPVTPGNSAIATRIVGEEAIVRSSGCMYPALARFYGMTQFEVRVRPDASMMITTQAEETLELPAPEDGGR